MVSASKRGSYLRIEVADNGVGLPPDWEMAKSRGHGLRLTRERLSALYPKSGEQCLTIRRRARGGTSVTILIPLRSAGMEWHGIVA